MQMDHIFVCVQAHAPEADALVALGLTEGSPNRHPGQGTANRRFFFDNAFLELLWLADAEEAQQPLTQPTRLYERLCDTTGQISPFGVCFRPSMPDELPNFPVWQYQPGYLPASLQVDIAMDTPLAEPMWFFLGFGSRPDQASASKQQPLQHSLGVKTVTALRLTVVTQVPLSQAATAAQQVSGVEVCVGDVPLLEISFDEEKQEQMRDFRPLMPLVLRW
ncbi:MAG: glyoxalase-like domain protein [Thiothrix lacustris]|uniref:Glyoxalase-like domain protein n=1 Tax=Thiothrix lacustris TaxID=525917 RepID=A0A1Y1QCV8_9GAMM|nr:MAG: glyoxalase-like domain protein [Thiothrix lacustris]